MRRRRRRWRWLPALLGLGLAVGLTQALLRNRVDPVIAELAVAAVDDLASNLIVDAVDQQVTDENIQYRDLVTLERGQNGNVVALSTNMQTMNRLKVKILKTLDARMNHLRDDSVTIPAGNITGIQLLSGRGPSIPVKIVAVASSDANFLGEFSDAGINQTIHRIVLNVSVDLLVLLPSGPMTEHVSTDVCVAETVLLGAVPGNINYFQSAGQRSTMPYSSAGTTTNANAQ